MTADPDRRAPLGPYKILAPVGAGGMGEVYKARDTRLDRIVAIKILPAHISGNAAAKQRFEREARRIAGLESSAHLPALRCRTAGRNGLPRDGVSRGSLDGGTS